MTAIQYCSGSGNSNGNSSGNNNSTNGGSAGYGNVPAISTDLPEGKANSVPDAPSDQHLVQGGPPPWITYAKILQRDYELECYKKDPHGTEPSILDGLALQKRWEQRLKQLSADDGASTGLPGAAGRGDGAGQGLFGVSGQFLDGVQIGLDVVGFIPGVGTVADVANGFLHLARGNYFDAGVSFVAAIPLFGDAIAATGKSSKHVAKALKWLDEPLVLARQALATSTGTIVQDITISARHLGPMINDATKAAQAFKGWRIMQFAGQDGEGWKRTRDRYTSNIKSTHVYDKKDMDAVVRELNLSKKQREDFHRYGLAGKAKGERLDYHELLQRAREYFNIWD